MLQCIGCNYPCFQIDCCDVQDGSSFCSLSSILVKFVTGEGAMMLRGGEMLTAEQLMSWVDVDVGVGVDVDVDVGLKAVVISG